MADYQNFSGLTALGGSVGSNSPLILWFKSINLPQNAIPAFKITNTENSIIYYGYGRGGKAYAQPSSSTIESSNAHAVGENTGVIENAPQGCDTIAIICAPGNNSSVEVSIGYGH